MAGSVFDIWVRIGAKDNGLTRGLHLASSKLAAFDQQTQQMLRRYKSMAAVGAGITAVGVGLAAGLKHAVDAAGELQSSLISVRQSLGLTTRQFAALQNMAVKEGIPTAFSAAQMGELFQGMQQGGLGKQLTAALKPNSAARKMLREYIAYADVRYLGKDHEAPMESVATAAQMAHSYGVYDLKGTHTFLNAMNAALASYHGNSSEFQTQFGFFAGQARKLHMTQQQAIETEAFFGRLGLGKGRGGTNINQFLNRILPTGQKKHDAAMRSAGFMDAHGHSVFVRNNKFVGWEAAARILHAFGQRVRDVGEQSKLLRNIFNEQGKRVADKLIPSGVVEQLHNVHTEMAKVASITKQQQERNATWEGQWKQLTSTLHDIEIQFGIALMPAALKFAHELNQIAGDTLEWTQAHPEVMEMAAAFATTAAKVALIVGPLKLIQGTMGYLFGSGMIRAGIGMTSQALLGFGEASRAAAVDTALTGGPNTKAPWWKRSSGLIPGLAPIAVMGAATAVSWANTKSDTAHIKHTVANSAETVGKLWIHSAKKAGKTHGKLWMDTLSKEQIDTRAWAESINTTAGDLKRNLYWIFGNIATAWEGMTGRMVDAWGRISFMVDIFGQTAEKLMHPSTWGTGPAIHGWDNNTEAGAAAMRAATKGAVLTVPGHARGTSFAPGGWSLVGERGPEIVNLPRGSEVIPNHRLGDLGGIHVHGDIVINQQPGESPESLAQRVLREMGRHLRSRTYASPDAVLPAW